MQKTALNTFLKTSLNTELVISILKGILILAASSSDKNDHMDDNDMYRIKQTTTIVMQEMKISNANHFSINDQGEQFADEDPPAGLAQVNGTASESQDPLERRRVRSVRILDSDSEAESETEADDLDYEQMRRQQQN